MTDSALEDDGLEEAEGDFQGGEANTTIVDINSIPIKIT